MAEPTLTATRLAGSAEVPGLLVVGPSLGTVVEVLPAEDPSALAGVLRATFSPGGIE